MRVSMMMAAVVCSAGLSMAAPIAATEPPDLPDTGGPTYVVDIGTNTISGSVNGSPGTGPDYADEFSIFVPLGLTVSSGSVTISNFSNGGGAAGLGCFTSAGCFGTNLFSGLGGFGPGTYGYTATSPWADDGNGGVFLGSFNYTLTLNVVQDTAPVPEPGTWALALTALAGVGAWRRRQ